MKTKLNLKRKKPAFLRQEWFRMGNQRKKWLKWRSVRGNQSKLRQHIKGKGFMPHPGYGMPAALRYLHPSGLKEVIINNVNELKPLDAKTCAARIAGGVGNRKRLAIQTEAQRLNVRVLNPRKIEMKVRTAQKTVSAEPSKPSVSKEEKTTKKEVVKK